MFKGLAQRFSKLFEAPKATPDPSGFLRDDEVSDVVAAPSAPKPQPKKVPVKNTSRAKKVAVAVPAAVEAPKPAVKAKAAPVKVAAKKTVKKAPKAAAPKVTKAKAKVTK